MIKGLAQHMFRVPVQAGEIVEVFDHGMRIRVRTREDFVGPKTVELGLSRGMALLKRPKVGDILIDYPAGHIDILSAEDFAMKVYAGSSVGEEEGPDGVH